MPSSKKNFQMQTQKSITMILSASKLLKVPETNTSSKTNKSHFISNARLLKINLNKARLFSLVVQKK